MPRRITPVLVTMALASLNLGSSVRLLAAPALPAPRAKVLPPVRKSAEPVKSASVEGITEYRLANGLRVLLFPDPGKPTITVNITYLVGSRHENYGETGMAHLLEHMLFKGTPKRPDIYKSSAISRYSLAGIPLITIVAFLSIVLTSFDMYILLSNPGFGLVNVPSYVFLALSYLLWIPVYFAFAWYRKKQGIDVSLAFKEIPPE